MTQKVGGVEFDVTVDSSGTATASTKIATDLDKVESSFMQVDAAADRAGDAMVKSGSKGSKATSQLSRNVGMGAVQFGQLAGQIQGGQSALLAFSQQGADIGMLFGPAGMVVGGVLSVASAIAGSFIPSLLEGGDAAETLAEQLRELQKENKLTANQVAFLEQEDRKANEAKQERIATIKEEIAELKEATSAGGSYTSVVAGAAAVNKDLASAIGDLLPTYREQRDELLQLQAELDKLEGKTGEGFTEAQQEANKKAIIAYQNRLAAIEMSVNRENEITTNAIQKRIAIEDGFLSEQEAQIKESMNNRIANEEAAYLNSLMMFKEQRMAILEEEALSGEQRQALLNELNLQQQYSELNHQNKLTEIEKQAADARMKLAEQEKQAKLSALSSTFSNLSSLMNTESRKLFEIGKAASVAGAIVDGYAAVSKTMASVPYPFNIPLAAAQAVASAAQVKGILSTSFGDRNAGQVFAGGQVATPVTQNQGAQTQQRNVSIALTGSNFSGSDIRALIGQINEELGDGATIGVTGG